MSEGLPEAAPAPPRPASVDQAAGRAGGRELGFLGHVNLVFLTYVAQAALTFGVSVLVARALGPDGRGVYALFLLSASLAQTVLSLGMNVAAVYYLGKRAYPLARVLANSAHVTLLSALVAGALVLLAWPTVGDRLLERDVPFWVFAFAVPLFVQYNVLTSVLQGERRFLAMNAVILVQPLVLLALLVVGMAIDVLDPAVALLFWCAATAVGVGLALALLGRPALDLAQWLRVDWSSLREQVTFGAKGQLGNLVQLLNYRLDQYLVAIFVSAAGVGLYAVSVTLSQGIWFIANAVAVVLLPQLTALDAAEAARQTPVACRNTLLVSVLAAAGLAVVAPWLVEALFGVAFRPSVVPLLWLLPGTVALAGSKVLTSYIFSQGRPLTNSLITIAALAVTLVADVVLIPPLGVTGAAIASSLAYGAHFALALVAYRRLSGGSIWEAVLVRGDDLRRYVEVARRLAPA